jgi:hypothetical protein
VTPMRCVSIFSAWILLNTVIGSLSYATEKRTPEETGTPGELFTMLEEKFGEQCLNMRDEAELKAKEFEAAGNTYQAYRLRGIRDMTCNCLPQRAHEARLALLDEERDAPNTMDELIERYSLPKVINPCIANMVHKMYGHDCAAIFAKQKLNPARFCPCMRSVLSRRTEAEITEIGSESSEYLGKVAQAKNDGASPPEPPPAYKKFKEEEAVCRK